MIKQYTLDNNQLQNIVIQKELFKKSMIIIFMCIENTKRN